MMHTCTVLYCTPSFITGRGVAARAMYARYIRSGPQLGVRHRPKDSCGSLLRWLRQGGPGLPAMALRRAQQSQSLRREQGGEHSGRRMISSKDDGADGGAGGFENDAAQVEFLLQVCRRLNDSVISLFIRYSCGAATTAGTWAGRLDTDITKTIPTVAAARSYRSRRGVFLFSCHGRAR